MYGHIDSGNSESLRTGLAMLHTSMTDSSTKAVTPISARYALRNSKNYAFRVVAWSRDHIDVKMFAGRDNALGYASELAAKHNDGSYRRLLVYRHHKVWRYWEWNHIGSGWQDMVGSVTKSGHYRLNKAK